MSIELNKLYDNYFELFASQGWLQFIELLKQRDDVLKELGMQVKNEYELGKLQGEHTGILTILNLEEAIKNEYDNR